MRWIVALSLLWGTIAQGQENEFCELYNEGYKDGWCEDYSPDACPPAPPSGCRWLGYERPTKGAYERGYHQGAEDSDFEVAPWVDEEE